MGGLGFALPAAIGVRMGAPDAGRSSRWSGDGSSLYASRRCGARRTTASACCASCSPTAATRSWTGSPAARRGGKAPWPAFTEVDVAGLATALGCPARRVDTADDLVAVLDEVVPTLAARTEPLLLEVAVPPEATFAP